MKVIQHLTTRNYEIQESPEIHEIHPTFNNFVCIDGRRNMFVCLSVSPVWSAFMKAMKFMKSMKHLTTRNNEIHETNVSAGRLNL